MTSRPAFTALNNSQYGNQNNGTNNQFNINGGMGMMSTMGVKQPLPQQPIGMASTMKQPQQVSMTAFSTPMQTPKVMQTPASKLSMAPIPMASLNSSIVQPAIPAPSAVRSTITGVSHQTNRYSAAPANPPKMSLGFTTSNNNKKSIPSMSIRPSATRVESRPISDKEFQRQCTTRIITFLTSNSYPSQITLKTLKSPSVKEFYAIVEFLFHHIDSTFKFTTKQDDELITFFKIIRYPFAISKRNLTSVGTPHTWPHLLAALSWLVELIEYDNAAQYDAENNMDQIQTDEDPFLREFNRHVVLSYQDGYLHGNDETQVDLLLEEHHGAKSRQFTEEFNEMSERINNQTAHMEEIRAEPNITGELREKIQAVNEEIVKYQEHIGRITNGKSTLEHSIESLTAQQASLDAQLAKLQEQKSSLEEIIAEQQKSSVDAKMLNQRRVQLQEDMSKTLREKNRLERAKQDKLTDISKIISSIDEYIMQYNEHARNLNLLKADGEEQTSSRNYQINFDHSNGDVIITDLKRIKKNLKLYIEEQDEKTNTTEEETNNKRNEMKQLEDDIADKQQQKKRSEQKFSNMENTCKREKEKLDKELSVLMDKVEKRQLANKAMKEDLRTELDHKNVLLEEANAYLVQQKDLMAKSLMELKCRVVTFLEAATAHQTKLAVNVKSVLDHMNQHCKAA